MNKTILVVDDYGAMRKLVRNILSHIWPHCRFVESASAEEAFEILERETPRAVIMDVELPGMSGIEATKRIAEQFPSCAVIVHSGCDDTWCGEQAFASGARDFVRKGDCEGLVRAATRLWAA
jgi:CheY-like chemotaxis protein